MGDGDSMTLCGVSGWYDEQTRDTDWFIVTYPTDGNGEMTCEFDAEQGTFFMEMPEDCGTPEDDQLIHVLHGCAPQHFVIHRDYNSDIEWLWVGPDTFYPPPGFIGHEYRYTLRIEGLDPGVIGTEAATWSRVKGLYRR